MAKTPPPPPPTAPPSTETPDAGSGADIIGIGVAAGLGGAVVGIAVTAVAWLLAFWAGEPTSPGSVAIIGRDPHSDLIRLVIPVGLLAFFATIVTMVQKRCSRPADQLAAGLLAVIVGVASPILFEIYRSIR